jgi:hypothetical protein
MASLAAPIVVPLSRASSSAAERAPVWRCVSVSATRAEHCAFSAAAMFSMRAASRMPRRASEPVSSDASNLSAYSLIASLISGSRTLADLSSSELLRLREKRVLPRQLPPKYQGGVTSSGPHAPLFFALHGDNDSLVPVEKGLQLSKESNNPVVYAFLAVVRSEHGGKRLRRP